MRKGGLLIIGIYLSGTGNTRHCIEKLCALLDPDSKVFPLESPSILNEITTENNIVLGYPTQFSNAPYMVRDFICSHSNIWRGKKIFCLVTMGAFSGDGAGCTARLLKKSGADILGGLHVHMPDSVCDSKLLKKTKEQNLAIIAAADQRIEAAAKQIRNGCYPQDGLSPVAHMVGLLGQRLWFYGKTQGYTDKLKISDACIGCGLCERLCPMENIKLAQGRAIPQGRCTMCYRCVSHCPQKAITLLGKTVQEQCRFEEYIQ